METVMEQPVPVPPVPVEDKPIEVGVVFQRAHARPVWFRWGRKRYDVHAVTHAWQERAARPGRAPAHHYAVAAAGNVFELRLNAETLQWSLGRVWSRS